MTDDHSAPRLVPPLEAIPVIVVGDTDPGSPGIYVFLIEGAGAYVGKYTWPSRWMKEYSRNVAKIVEGRPYRPQKPDGFRPIHRRLYDAISTGKRVSLLILENTQGRAEQNKRERELIAAIGTLNGPGS